MGPGSLAPFHLLCLRKEQKTPISGVILHTSANVRRSVHRAPFTSWTCCGASKQEHSPLRYLHPAESAVYDTRQKNASPNTSGQLALEQTASSGQFLQAYA